MTLSFPPRETLAAPGIDRAAAPRRAMLPSRARVQVSSGSIFRRRIAVRLAKLLLPVGALALLGAIALWPEIDGAADRGRMAFRRATQATAEAGQAQLAALVAQAAGRIAIMPGAGIGASNIQALAARTGAHEFHASAKRRLPPEPAAGLFAEAQWQTDAALVAELVAHLGA